MGERQMAFKCLVQEQLRVQYKQIADPSLVNFLLKEDDRLTIYFALIDRTTWSEVKKIDIATAIVLLQQSLDLHQLVSNEVAANNTEIILHGDRFSAEYYLLLSQYGENELIRSLSFATKTINQLLIQFADRNVVDISTVESLQVKIDTALVIYLLRYFNLDQLEHAVFGEVIVNQKDEELVELASLINACFKSHFQNRVIV